MMTELRWILLAAGLLLIAGIYVWGLRMRSRSRGVNEMETRPPVFTGGATGFEREPAAQVLDADAPGRDDDDEERRLAVPAASRRIEPSVTLDEDDDTDAADGGTRHGVDADDVELSEPPPAARREPTFSMRSEPAPPMREPPAGLRPRATPPAVELPHTPPPESRHEPATAPAGERAPAHPASGAAGAAKPTRAAQKIIALRVVAMAGARFDGAALLHALQDEGLAFGRYEIFHRLHADGRPVFSAASLREPGRFDLATMPATQYPGVALFAVLPGPLPAADAFDELIYTARALATHLNGALADERGAPLTAHRVTRLREEALDFGRAAGMA